eukprot:14227381-Alexandrium_andersonii.AAC.1
MSGRGTFIEKRDSDLKPHSHETTPCATEPQPGQPSSFVGREAGTLCPRPVHRRDRELSLIHI